MTTRTKIWLYLRSSMVLSFLVHTNGRPSVQSRGHNFIAKMEQNGSAPEAIAMIRQFGEEDTGKHFIMINNIDYNETPGTSPVQRREKMHSNSWIVIWGI